MKKIYGQLVAGLKSGFEYSLGTLLYTRGSAPQVAGALAIFDHVKVVSGTLGGGLLEARAQKAAGSGNRANILEWVHFDAEMDDPEGAICGGTALFAIDADPKKHLAEFEKLLDSLRRNKPGVLFSFFRRNGSQNPEIERFWIGQNEILPETLKSVLIFSSLRFQQIINDRKAIRIESVQIPGESPDTEVSLFIEPVHPVQQLLIVGAGHIGQALCKLGDLAGFEVQVLDNRADMVAADRFSEASGIICGPVETAFKSVLITPETYIVIAGQNHQTDMEALRCCICSDAAYIGVIGSRRKMRLMEQKFIEQAWATPEEWKFIHSPVGLDIHSKTVNEIAISIVAELISERYELNFSGKRKTIDCLILAAGKSTRMGTQKLLLDYENSSIIKSIVTKSLNSNASQTYVVTGSHKHEIRNELEGLAVEFVENERFEEGMLSSVQAGVSAIPETTDGMLILLGDQPMVSTQLINRLITSFRKTEKCLIIPTFNGRRGHPVLISSKYKNQISSLNPEVGLRELFAKYSHDILEVEAGTSEILNDIDTPEDYRRETKLPDRQYN
ncbi:MAG: NTP transferase domain-containing protein [Prolixibacteraceae bacterium]